VQGRGLSTLPVAAYGGRLFIPTWEGEVYAFDPLTRETLWNAELEGEVWGGLALDEERVYVAAWDGVLRALEHRPRGRRRGASRWAR
jgi:outer membrane protein assembly factor BamB